MHRAQCILRYILNEPTQQPQQLALSMAVEQTATSRPTFVASLNILFYFSACNGLIPFSIPAYWRHRVLQRSIISNVFAVVFAIQNIVQYHFASTVFSMGDKKESGTLTVIIGYVIIYMEPAMLAFDVIAVIVHQKLVIRLMAHMQHVDDQLARQHVHLGYGNVKRLTIWLLSIVTVFELGIVTYNFLLFQQVVLKSAYWFVTFVPLFLSSVSKIWFIVLMTNVKMKFEAINASMQQTVDYYVALRDGRKAAAAATVTAPTRMATAVAKDMGQTEGSGFAAEIRHESEPFFLQQEIIAGGRRQRAAFRAKKPTLPEADIFTMSYGKRDNDGVVQVKPFAHSNRLIATLPMSALTFDRNAQLDEKQPHNEYQTLNRRLTVLCQLHDEICDIGKGINRLFSFQMLILMAYGFMSLTAKLYFVYCGMTSQNIPILFRSAESLPVSVTFILYTGAKCVYVIYISWQTKLTAQRTGVMVHKVANVVDQNECYVVVNHLSLKLLNHHLNFTACGFFDLDMTTLYAVRKNKLGNRVGNWVIFFFFYCRSPER